MVEVFVRAGAMLCALLLAACAITGTAPSIGALANASYENDLGRFAEAP